MPLTLENVVTTRKLPTDELRCGTFGQLFRGLFEEEEVVVMFTSCIKKKMLGVLPFETVGRADQLR